LLFLNRAKKGYYIRRVKDTLWSTFGIAKIKPFADNFTKEQLKSWKQQANVQQVHDDLYHPSEPNDPNSDTYLTIIIRSVFPPKECTTANAIWTQAVLEAIFDTNHLSTKLDSDIIEQWTKRLSTNTDDQAKVKVLFVCLFFVYYSAKYLVFRAQQHQVPSLQPAKKRES
jgi:hypothetical protein